MSNSRSDGSAFQVKTFHKTFGNLSGFMMPFNNADCLYDEVLMNEFVNSTFQNAKDYHGLNDVVKEVYYQVWNPEQLDEKLSLLLEQKEDPMLLKPQELFNRLKLKEMNAAQNIIADLRKELLS